MAYQGNRCAVVALGGNAISPPDEEESVANQFRHTRSSLRGIVELLHKDYLLAITHGNGPQVGDELRRVELASDELPYIPLGLLVANTEGSMGYMIEQSLKNLLEDEGIDREVVSLVTQVLVDENDPALSNPTKFIGQVFSRGEAEQFIKVDGWSMKPINNGEKWRRVVGSPEPINIVNRKTVRNLVYSGVIVITAGGGGIPVYNHPQFGLEGIDAVIDKDLAAAVLARDIDADELIVLTNIDTVKIDYKKPTQQDIHRMTVKDARDFLEAGQFPPGSMGPKIRAAVQFLEHGGERTIICDLNQVSDAIHGNAGTEIIR